MRFLSRVLPAILVFLASGPLAAVTGLTYGGRVLLPRDTVFDGIRVGGLSSLEYDPVSRTFWALSDDRGAHGPVRAYQLRINLVDGRNVRKDPTVEIVGVLSLTARGGKPFEAARIDPEGMAHSKNGLFLSTEPIPAKNVPAMIGIVSPDGRLVREIRLPAHFQPAPGKGVRENLGFEGLAVTRDGRFLFAGMENAMEQDGPVADIVHGSPSRILRFDLEKQTPPDEFVYMVEPVTQKAPTPEAFSLNGLSDLLPLDEKTLLVLEREYVAGAGNGARIWEASLDGATGVSSFPSLSGTPWVPAKKTLLADLSEIGFPLENFEGMTLGPDLPDGRGTLVIVSDDNFNSMQESTMFLVFAVERAPVTIQRVQGAAHRSPLEGSWVQGVEGVVTAIDPDPKYPGFFMESAVPDGDPRTSEGIFVSSRQAPGITPGTALVVNGRVEEFGARGTLPVTRLRASSVTPSGANITLPPPAKLFTDIRMPKAIDGDGFSSFDIKESAMDLWESLEGMRVEVPGGAVTGPSSARGDIVLRPDGASEIQGTRAGGVRLLSLVPPLERVFLSRRITGTAPQVNVGARLKGPITGVVDYASSNYRIQTLAPVTVERENPLPASTATFAGDKKRLTVGGFNVENFSVAVEPQRVAGLARVITKNLLAPDIIGLEEVQDDSGPAKGDSVVSAKKTLEALVSAIVTAGGPRYEAVWIDPVDGKEGGQPGGNIRVALLVNPARVELVRRGEAGPLDATEPLGKGSKLHLSLSPGRVAPTSKAFSPAEGEGVRRSLAAEVRFRGKTVFVIVNHWSSKMDDDRLFGSVRPPRAVTVARRVAQAQEIRSFITKILEADPRARVVALGDLNDFEFSEAVTTLAAPPLTNLILQVPEEERYTFNFEGASQVLDHIIVSPELAKKADINIVHANSDAADEQRTSDHDPLVARFEIK